MGVLGWEVGGGGGREAARTELALEMAQSKRSDEPSRLAELRGRVDLGEARLQLQAHLIRARFVVSVGARLRFRLRLRLRLRLGLRLRVRLRLRLRLRRMRRPRPRPRPRLRPRPRPRPRRRLRLRPKLRPKLMLRLRLRLRLRDERLVLISARRGQSCRRTGSSVCLTVS